MHRHTTTSASHWTGLDGVARSPRSLDQLQEFETELLYEVCSLVIPPSSEKAEATKRRTLTLVLTLTLTLALTLTLTLTLTSQLLRAERMQRPARRPRLPPLLAAR